MSNDKAKKNLLYIGKIKPMSGPFGTFQVLHFNLNPEFNKDGSANSYYEGMPAWIFPDGRVIKMKSASLKGVGARDAERGYTSSIAVDLDSTHDYEILVDIEEEQN